MNERLKEKRIFISYGHDIYAPVAERLATDLKQYALDVWFDAKNIHSNATNWAAEIEKGIEECDIVLALMTKHAHRSPTGICTNEIIYASNRQKEIRPILVENMEIPLLLCAIQYFDINDVFDASTQTLNEAVYAVKFKQLVEELQDEQNDFKGYLNNIKAYLQPQDNRLEIARRASDFIGRKWLFEIYESWVASNRSNVLFLLGKPGCGKTSFLSKLVLSYSDIKGIHYCHYNDKKSVSVKSIIKTISYHLITQVPDYAELFGDIDIQALSDKNEEQFFELLITNPLSRISSPSSPILVAIDAIDEMAPADRTVLIRILNESHSHLPDWLKLVITSRVEYGLENQLRVFRPVTLDVTCQENRNDLRRLIELHPLGQALSEEDKELLLTKSDGIIQYVKLALEELSANEAMEIERLPGGMFGIFQRDFIRFSSTASYEPLKQFLNVLCAFKEPAELSFLKEICGERTVASALSVLGGYVLTEHQTLSLFHKSLYDWLTDFAQNPEYAISASDGNEAICAWMKRNAYRWQDIPYFVRQGMLHFYERQDSAELLALLSEQNTAIYDCFIDLVCRLLSGRPAHDKWILSTLSLLLRSDLDCEYIAARCIKAWIEHGDSGDGLEILQYCFAKQYPWITPYIQACQSRYAGDWKALLALSEQLLGQVSHQAILTELYDYLGDAYRITGDHENAFRYYQLAFGEIPKFLRAEKCFSSLYNYLDLRYVKGFVTEAEQEIISYGETVKNDPPKQYRVQRLLGNIRFQKGDLTGSLVCFEASYELAKASHRQYLMAEALYSMAECLAQLDPDRALACIEESRRIANKFHYRYGYAKSFFASTERLVRLERWQEAIEEGEEGIRLLTETGYLTGVARINRSLAVALLRSGRYEDAIERAMSSLMRYKQRDSYPIARLKNYLTILQAAKALGCLEQYLPCDDPSLIPNLSEFPNSASLLAEIQAIQK